MASYAIKDYIANNKFNPLKNLKMKASIRITLVLSAFFLLQYGFTQTEPKSKQEKLSLNSGNIESQFEYVFRKSGDFTGTNGQPYEAVKLVSLLKLKANVLDSLRGIYTKIEASKEIIESQAKEIIDLKSQLNTAKNTLEQTNTEKNNIALFGIQTSKTKYHIIMWAIIIILFALLILFIFKFKNSNVLTKAAMRKLDEVETEFDDHRRIALEREQKVRRQLQDEINKNKP